MKIEEEAEQFEAYLAQLGYVKVIRCKDCVWWNRECWCRNSDSGPWDDDSYCSEATRKEK